MNCGTYLYLPEEYSLFIQIFILYFVMRREQRFAKMQIFAYDFKIVFYEIQNWQVHFFTKKKEFEDIPFSSKNGDHSGWFGLVVLICKDIALCKLGISYKNISI